MPYLFAWRHRKGIARSTRLAGGLALRGGVLALLVAAAGIVALKLRASSSTDAPASPSPAPTDAAATSSDPTDAEPAATDSAVVAPDTNTTPEPHASDDDGVDETGRESFPASDPPSTY